MKKKVYLSVMGLALLCGALSAHASPGWTDVKSHVLPAVYKSEGGLTQKVEISARYEGEPATATVRLGERSRKEKVVPGENVFLFEIPEVSASTRLPLTLTCGKEREETTVTVEPVRHWQMNMVQHTHTDIGYTRSQMEILAEHLRYIDYALDYCDATDDYPDFAKFRWTCE